MTMISAARAISDGRESTSASSVRPNDGDGVGHVADDDQSPEDEDDEDDFELSGGRRVYVGNLPNAITVDRLTK